MSTLNRDKLHTIMSGTSMRRMVLGVGAFAAVVGGVMYPIFVAPLLHSQQYQNMQKQNRAGIKQEEIQPGGMVVWSNPFGEKDQKKDS
ncbi:small integral membrane protein 20-like isoform X1 [Branchiostoma lanceolatum]|uniref:small integral membrane protein 20-like isoform X1 n=1 Tax=Branchiostoma lanceolatum TaxID=7740 RepID=UPI003452C6CA